MMKRVPIVVVLGATGAGKSKLALELAHKFGGEIISADAMQMYKGLDIVTNKVSDEEQKLVKHHMIDFLDPLLKSSVIDFRNQVSLNLKKKDTINEGCCVQKNAGIFSHSTPRLEISWGSSEDPYD